MTSATASDLVGHVPRLSKFQRFTVERIPRGMLKNAKYNPRKITPDAKERLRGVLQQQGLIEAIVWNKKTGNLVGGHQRLSCLDALEGSPDYALDVCVVDLADKEEREANAALNNPSIQGVFDAELFEDFMQAGDFDFAKAGFSEMELGAFLSDRPAPIKDAGSVAQGLAALGVVGGQVERPEPEAAGPKMPPREDDLPPGDDAEDENGEFDDSNGQDASAPKHYAIVVFRDERQRLAFYEALGVEPGRHVDGGDVMAMLEDAGEGED